MSKRHLLCVGAMMLLAVAVFLSMRRSIPKHHVSRASFDKIQAGMTVDEVEGILGVPSGDYTTTRVLETDEFELSLLLTLEPGELKWLGDEGALIVLFDAQGKASRARVIAMYFFPPSGSFRDTLQALIGFKKPGRIGVGGDGLTEFLLFGHF